MMKKSSNIRLIIICLLLCSNIVIGWMYLSASKINKLSKENAETNIKNVLRAKDLIINRQKEAISELEEEIASLKMLQKELQRKSLISELNQQKNQWLQKAEECQSKIKMGYARLEESKKFQLFRSSGQKGEELYACEQFIAQWKNHLENCTKKVEAIDQEIERLQQAME